MLNAGGNLPLQKLIAQAQRHVSELLFGIGNLTVFGRGLGDEAPHFGRFAFIEKRS